MPLAIWLSARKRSCSISEVMSPGPDLSSLFATRFLATRQMRARFFDRATWPAHQPAKSKLVYPVAPSCQDGRGFQRASGVWPVAGERRSRKQCRDFSVNSVLRIGAEREPIRSRSWFEETFSDLS